MLPCFARVRRRWLRARRLSSSRAFLILMSRARGSARLPYMHGVVGSLFESLKGGCDENLKSFGTLTANVISGLAWFSCSLFRAGHSFAKSFLWQWNNVSRGIKIDENRRRGEREGVQSLIDEKCLSGAAKNRATFKFHFFARFLTRLSSMVFHIFFYR